MEAGYDYLLLRGRLQRRFFNFPGLFLFVIGAILLATSGTYYGYAAKARADLDSLNVTLPETASGAVEVNRQPQAIPSHTAEVVGSEAAASAPAPRSETTRDIPAGRTEESAPPAMEWPLDQDTGVPAVAEKGSAIAAAESTGVAGAAASLPIQSVSADRAASPIRALSASAISSQRLFPGESLLARFWSNPLAYESASYREQALLRGFTPVDLGEGLPLGSRTAATRIIVPSIDVDSRVTELAILDLGGSRAYETPAHTVGHIPETAKAGEAGSSWFFGHTETPLMGEGSVFFNLSQIPGKLQNGEDIFVITESGDHKYLYRITSSEVVHQRDMRLFDTGQATIHLVSCVPRLVYDHRLIVSGKLVGYK